MSPRKVLIGLRGDLRGERGIAVGADQGRHLRPAGFHVIHRALAPDQLRHPRRFKLLGYTDRQQDTPAVANDEGKKHAGLDILKTLPLSAWFETSFTSTSKTIDGTQNGSFQFPQDVSLFLAGAWSTHVGSFLQITYDPQADHFSMDNTDIRITDKGTLGGKELVYGLTLNNNPTLEDLWHTTPAWGYPFVASPSAPSPAAAPFVQGALAQDVAGLGGYAMWNDRLYAAVAIYRSNHLGGSQPNPGTGTAFNIQGVAPYWRLAWQQPKPSYSCHCNQGGQ